MEGEHTPKKAQRFVPHKYQEEAIRFGVSRPSAAFFLAPGLGKTMITYSIYGLRRKLGHVRRMLVVAKRRIVYNVWPKEADKWMLPWVTTILHGPHKEGRLLESNADVFLINYEGLEWLQRTLKKHRIAMGEFFDMIVFDESSKIKNTKTKRFKMLRKMVHDKKHPVKYINLLTGSPVPKNLMDIFGQVYMMDGGQRLGAYITQYRNRYFYPSGYMGYDFKILPGAEEQIYDAIGDIVVRYGNEELDLPPLVHVPRALEFSEETMKKYKELEEEFILEVEKGVIVASNAAVATGKLRQFTGGAIYDKHHKVLEIHEEKLADLEEIIEELQGEPLLIAYEYTHEIERIRKIFPDMPYIGGGVSDKEADKICDQWNRGELPYLAGNPASIAHGLNLQEGTCSNIYIFTETYNLEDYEQFLQRVWRQGVKVPRIRVHHPTALGTIDEVVIKVREAKDDQQKAFLEAMEQRYNISFRRGAPNGRAKTSKFTEDESESAVVQKKGGRKKVTGKKKVAGKKKVSSKKKVAGKKKPGSRGRRS